MTPDEIIDLLTLIASCDQRTVGETDVEVWHTIATECGWTWPLAKRAVIEHHSRGGEKKRITPAHITDAIEAARAQIRRQVFQRDLMPPKELADSPLAELEWRRQHIAAVTERALNAWAEGQPLPQLQAAPTENQPQRDVDTLIGRAFRLPKEAP